MGTALTGVVQQPVNRVLKEREVGDQRRVPAVVDGQPHAQGRERRAQHRHIVRKLHRICVRQSLASSVRLRLHVPRDTTEFLPLCQSVVHHQQQPLTKAAEK